MAKKVNPNGANQWQPDPRQSLFLKYYLDPKSETFSNALKSAIRAGYEKKYAQNILNKELSWLGEFVERRKRMLNKAEKRLEKSLESKNEKIGLDSAIFIAKTLGKNEYSERKELTGVDGKDLFIPSPEEQEEVNDALKNI